eukprot:14311944-Heterocapsa_arctica.AAC.1
MCVAAARQLSNDERFEQTPNAARQLCVSERGHSRPALEEVEATTALASTRAFVRNSVVLAPCVGEPLDFLDARVYAAVNVTDYVNDSQRPA